MSVLKIIVIGAQGRMGKEVLKLIESSEEFELFAKLDQGDQVSELKVDPKAVVVDFSDSSLFEELFDWCEKNSLALVSGTTALSETSFKKIKSAQFPVLWAPNMSLGVAFVNKLVKELKHLPDGFDFQIEEAHHRHKKDKPSGTAIYLQETLNKTLGKEQPEPLSVRGGGIFGEHKISAMSEEEVIRIEHIALNRSVWARGALKVAQWLSRQEGGSYSIEDVLK